ncbi:MAG: FHA domain-containing protein [Myxococcaceae bacterium]
MEQTVRELKELTHSLTRDALLQQLGPFVLVQRPFTPQPRAMARGVTAPLGKRPTASFDFEDLWILTLPPVRSRDAFTIGRGAECDVVVDEKTVSSVHAKIDWADLGPNHRAAMLFDMKSSNGTLLNGDKVSPDEPKLLRDNDAVDIGSVRLLYMTTDTFLKRIGRK